MIFLPYGARESYAVLMRGGVEEGDIVSTSLPSGSKSLIVCLYRQGDSVQLAAHAVASNSPHCNFVQVRAVTSFKCVSGVNHVSTLERLGVGKSA